MVGKPKIVLGIDPGPSASGWCFWNGAFVPAADGATPNHLLIEAIHEVQLIPDCIVIEKPGYYGKIMGATVLETAFWGGYVTGYWHRHNADIEVLRPTYGEVALHHTGLRSAPEAQVRASLVQRFGQGFKHDGKGVKKDPGPLYHLSRHAWSAFALAAWRTDQETKP